METVANMVRIFESDDFCVKYNREYGYFAICRGDECLGLTPQEAITLSNKIGLCISGYSDQLMPSIGQENP